MGRGGSESGALLASILGKILLDNVLGGRGGNRGGVRERDGQGEGVPSRVGERGGVPPMGFMWETGRYCRLLVGGGEGERDVGGFLSRGRGVIKDGFPSWEREREGSLGPVGEVGRS